MPEYFSYPHLSNVISNCISQLPLTSSEYSLLLELINYLPNVSPSIDAISNKIKISKSQIKRNIKKLEYVGLKITKVHRQCNIYHVDEFLKSIGFNFDSYKISIEKIPIVESLEEELKRKNDAFIKFRNEQDAKEDSKMALVRMGTSKKFAIQKI